jgi:hypothetical protein
MSLSLKFSIIIHAVKNLPSLNIKELREGSLSSNLINEARRQAGKRIGLQIHIEEGEPHAISL